MPNIVNRMLIHELERDIDTMGSCLVVEFDQLTVEQAEDIRKQFRQAGLAYRVVRNRIASKAFAARNMDLSKNLKGKCGIVFAPEERAIEAAKMLREFAKARKLKEAPISPVGAVIEGQVLPREMGPSIADMPDRKTVQGQLASVIAGPMRALATAMAGLPSGLARCVQARVDQQSEGSET